MTQDYLGFDIGGTKIEGALISKKEGQGPNILSKERFATKDFKNIEEVINAIETMSFHLCKKENKEFQKISGIGLGLPGGLHPSERYMINGNTPMLIGQSLEKKLGEHFLKNRNFSPPIISNNDANCFALAEVSFGAGLLYLEEEKIPLHKQIGVGIILGTGTGGGLCIGGKIFEGAFGGAMEVGHSYLKYTKDECYCHQKGHAEQFLCGPSLEKKYFQLANKKISALEIFTSSHDLIAKNIVEDFKNDLKLFLTNLTNLISPHYFVLGGGVSLQKIIYEGLETHLKENSFINYKTPRVYQHQIGDSAGVLGCVIPFF